MSKHTPGPWRVAGLNIGSANEKVVASCYKDSPESVVVRPDTTEECLANALLISLAPQMYEALKWTVAVCEELLRDGDQSEGLRLKKARAILNKLEVTHDNG